MKKLTLGIGILSIGITQCLAQNNAPDTTTTAMDSIVETPEMEYEEAVEMDYYDDEYLYETAPAYDEAEAEIVMQASTRINKFKNDPKRKVVANPDKKAVYSAGAPALFDYINRNVRVPGGYGSSGARMAQYVFISFVVGKDSVLYNPEILSTPGSTYTYNANDIIEKLPEYFLPAMQNGKLVDSIIIIPIRFEYNLYTNQYNYYYPSH